MKSSQAARIALLVFAASVPANAAVDAEKFAQALTARLDGLGFALKSTGVEAQGENVVLKGATINIKSEKGKEKALGDVVLENVIEADGGYKIGQVTAPANQIVDGTFTLDFGGAKIVNFTVPPATEADPAKYWSVYETIEVGPMKFSNEGVTGVTMDGATLSMSPYAAGQPSVMTMSVPNLVWNLAVVKEAQAQAFFASAGYTEFVAAINVKGSWNPADGRMVIEEESINVKDVGKLNFTTDLSGYTAQFVKSIQEMSQTAEGQSDAENGMKVMGLLQGLTLNSVALRFDDASITGKVLDFASKQSGQPKEALVAQVKAMAPMMVMQLGDTELMQQFTTAVTAFMDGPKSIEIKTGEPVPFSSLIGVATTNPMAIVPLLKLKVMANQ
jgi:hypothetical protein